MAQMNLAIKVPEMSYKRKKVKYTFLAEKVNPETGIKEVLAIVTSKQRRGCPTDLIISIGQIRPSRPVSIIRRKRA